MRLLDVATVITGDQHFPVEIDWRECAVDVVLLEACPGGEPTGAPVISGSDTLEDLDVSRPFGILATLDRRVSCHREDDDKWLAQQLSDATEQAAGRALVVQPYPEAGVWIGSAAAGQAADVIAARTLWSQGHVGVPGEVPILHVAPEGLPALITADVVQVSTDGEKAYTVWGDPVVVNAGYSGFPAFWSGPLDIYLSTVRYEDELWRDVRGNLVSIRANRLMQINASPCGFVRAGAMPTP